MSSLVIPQLVVMHDRDHGGDLERLRQSAEISSPVEIWSFTDTGERFQDFPDEPLRRFAGKLTTCDTLLIQTDLMFNYMTLADASLSYIEASDGAHRLGVFDDDYEVMWTNLG